MVVEPYLLVANELQYAVYTLLTGHLPILETEAPEVHEWSHGDVESTVSGFRNLLGQTEHLDEHIIGNTFWVVAVD